MRQADVFWGPSQTREKILFSSNRNVNEAIKRDFHENQECQTRMNFLRLALFVDLALFRLCHHIYQEPALSLFHNLPSLTLFLLSFSCLFLSLLVSAFVSLVIFFCLSLSQSNFAFSFSHFSQTLYY